MVLRTGVFSNQHITRIINLVETYKSTEMTLEAFIEVEKLEEKLDGFYKTYEIFSKRIQAEMYKEGVDQATIDADFDTMIQTMDEVIFAKIMVIKNKRREWLEKDREKRILQILQQQSATQAATQAQFNRDIISQVIATISTAYSVPVAPGDVNLSPTASQTKTVELILKTLTTSQFAAVSVPNPTPPVVSSLTTESCSFPNTSSYQSKENIQTEEKETGTASLPHPLKKGDSLSDSPDGPDGYPDKKRKLSKTGWSRKNHIINRKKLLQRPKRQISPVKRSPDGKGAWSSQSLTTTKKRTINLRYSDAVESKNLLSSSSNKKTACTLNIQEAPATPAEAPCPLIIQEAPTILAEAPCALISEKAPANPAEAPRSLSHQETPTYQAEVPDTLNCLKTKDSIIRIPPAGSKEKAILTFLFFPSGRPAASLETLNSFLSQLQQTNFSSSGNLSSSPEIQEASKENPQQAAAFVNSTIVASNQEVIPKFRSPCRQSTILPEFASQQNSMKRKRLEPVKTAPKRISRRFQHTTIGMGFWWQTSKESQQTLNRNQIEWTINGIRSQLTKQLLLIQAIHLQPHFQISNPTDIKSIRMSSQLNGLYWGGPQQSAPNLLSLPTQSIVSYPTQP
ncbi:hypothetical protein DAPPUDRAFT_269242 [Daphnia pulex]|uniref:Uncharacterized protein n=1 Tax=Daphnia pulex TaxID=6669 RepID=E9HZ23_DAPPU|nr:hypothetical protein DAPPUDRAFT_269242 [Daphnia pulex]|eukprot:EFX63008.1 hypothetical protein DAPPUDRAFT_269242 [Daphnia pulex]